MDYASWPIKELRRFLTERGQDPAGIVEKADLVARVRMQNSICMSGKAEGCPGACRSGAWHLLLGCMHPLHEHVTAWDAEHWYKAFLCQRKTGVWQM